MEPIPAIGSGTINGETMNDLIGVEDRYVHTQSCDRSVLSFPLKNKDEIKEMVEFNELLEQGDEYLSRLYFWRSLSKPVEPVLARQDVGQAKKQEILQRTLELLKPAVQLCQDILSYNERFMKSLTHCVDMSEKSLNSDEPILEGFYITLNRFCDQSLQFFRLKQIKQSFFIDLKKAEEIYPEVKMQISSPFPFLDVGSNDNICFRYKNQELIKLIKDNCTKSKAWQRIISQTAMYTQNAVENKEFLLPEELFSYLRGFTVAYHCTELVAPKVLKTPAASFLSKYVNIPLFEDIPVALFQILKIEQPKEDPADYSVRANCPGMLKYYNSLVSEFMIAKFNRENTIDTPNQSEDVIILVEKILNFLSDINILIQMQMAYCYTYPAIVHNCPQCGEPYPCYMFNPDSWAKLSLPPGQLDPNDKTIMCCKCEEEGIRPNFTPPTIRIEDKEGNQYLLSCLFNLSPADQVSLIKLISMIKSLDDLLLKNELLLKTDLFSAVYHKIQSISLDDILYWLHHADKKASKESEVLVAYFLQVRILLTDWVNGSVPDPKNDYQLRSKERGRVEYNKQFKMVQPRNGPIILSRYYLQRLYDQDSPAFKLKGFFAKKSFFSSEDIEKLNTLHRVLFNLPYLTNFDEVLKKLSNLDFLWFRERFIEQSNLIQIPIEYSIPYFLLNYLIENPFECSFRTFYHLFDIYNDAESCLTTYKIPYLFQELESEANTTIEILSMNLANQIYIYFKQIAIYSMKRQPHPREKDPNPYLPLKQHPEISILGRHLDLQTVLTKHFNTNLTADIDFTITRYENTDLTGLVELQITLDMLKSFHVLLSGYSYIDTFEILFNTANGTMELPNKGRILTHTFASIVGDLTENYTYLEKAKRFIRPRPKPGEKLKPLPHPGYLFTRELEKEWQIIFAPYNDFIGSQHVNAMVGILTSSQLSILVEKCICSVEGLISNDIKDELEIISNKFRTFAVPKMEEAYTNYFSSGVWRLFLQNTKILMEEPEQVGLLYNNLKLLGNIICFLRLLESAIERREINVFIQSSAFLGINSEIRNKFEMPTSNALIEMADKLGYINMAKRTTEEYQASSMSVSLYIPFLRRMAQALAQYPRALMNLNPIEGDASPYFFIWSALLFQFCHSTENFTMLYGEGCIFAGTTIVYLLGQDLSFKSNDFSTYTRTIYQTENKIDAASKPLEKMDRDSFTIFIQNSYEAYDLNNKVEMIFTTHFDTRGRDTNVKKDLLNPLPDNIDVPETNRQLDSLISTQLQCDGKSKSKETLRAPPSASSESTSSSKKSSRKNSKREEPKPPSTPPPPPNVSGSESSDEEKKNKLKKTRKPTKSKKNLEELPKSAPIVVSGDEDSDNDKKKKKFLKKTKKSKKQSSSSSSEEEDTKSKKSKKSNKPTPKSTPPPVSDDDDENNTPPPPKMPPPPPVSDDDEENTPPPPKMPPPPPVDDDDDNVPEIPPPIPPPTFSDSPKKGKSKDDDDEFHAPPPIPESEPPPASTPKDKHHKKSKKKYNTLEEVPKKYYSKLYGLTLYPYEATRDDELTFDEGVELKVINVQDDGWFEAEVNGKRGVAPGNYIQPFVMK